MTFDATAIAWYGAVCGLLSLTAPRLGGRIPRIIAGIVVGIVAATLLPLLRAQLGL
ncbi:MAG: hypothetical protein AB7O39_02545 [Flavobacteriaceae bacterium]